MDRMNIAGEPVDNVNCMFIPRLDIEEHRFRTDSYARGRIERKVRVELWSIVFTDLDAGKTFEIIDGRSGQETVEVPAKVLAATSALRGH